MSEPENFLARWSRRKAATTGQDLAEKEAAPTATPEIETPESDNKNTEAAGAHVPIDTPAPAFDPSTLPPIESIDAGTDVSAFLQSGVPAETVRAALRRAWATDPTIRDYVGLAENSWDFTAPDAIPGFGPLSAEDAGRAIAQLSGKVKDAAERIATIEPSAEPDQAKTARKDLAAPKQLAREEQNGSEKKSDTNADVKIDATTSPQRNKENIATQQNDFESDEIPVPTRRSHGGALPD